MWINAAIRTYKRKMKSKWCHCRHLLQPHYMEENWNSKFNSKEIQEFHFDPLTCTWLLIAVYLAEWKTGLLQTYGPITTWGYFGLLCPTHSMLLCQSSSTETIRNSFITRAIMLLNSAHYIRNKQTNKKLMLFSSVFCWFIVFFSFFLMYQPLPVI